MLWSFYFTLFDKEGVNQAKFLLAAGMYITMFPDAETMLGHKNSIIGLMLTKKKHISSHTFFSARGDFIFTYFSVLGQLSGDHLVELL